MGNHLRAGKGGTRAGIALPPYRFARGLRIGPAEVSPKIGGRRRRALARWLRVFPAELAGRIPSVKIALAPRLWTPAHTPAHAASFIPQRYLLLDEPLFSRPGELGRILYHELCHFIWPRLGSRRRLFEAAILREQRARARGELGHSAALAKAALKGPARGDERRWRHYLCESFCDTGAYLLLRLAGHRRTRHSEWTLPAKAREARSSAWFKAVGTTFSASFSASGSPPRHRIL